MLQPIAGVVVQARRGVSSMEIQVSRDGSTWNDQGVLNYSTFRIADERVEMKFTEPQLARYIRFTMLAYEIHASMRAAVIVESSDTWTTLDGSHCTLSASTSKSSSYGPAQLKSAAGKPWHSEGTGLSQWIQFTFPDAVSVSGFRTSAPAGLDTSAFKEYKFQSSVDGATWTTVNQGRGANQDCCDWQTITFPGTTAKFFRLFMVNDWGYKWISINNLELRLSSAATVLAIPASKTKVSTRRLVGTTGRLAPRLCKDQPDWKDNFGSSCSIYVAHGRCINGAITTKQTRAEMTGWATIAPYDACCACGGGRPHCHKLSTLAENKFSDKGDTTLSRSNTYTYTLSCGYTVKLSGWTHTRNYHKGFLLNQKGEGLAVVEGLKPGTEYSYLIYQHASSFAGVHEYKVNGRTRGETTSGTTDEATGNGLAVADTDGKVTFAFQRESSKSGGDHVALTGLALAEATHCYKLSTLAENNFSDKGDTTLSRSNTYTFTLSCGYIVKLSGWTHTRNYHKGFLLNQKGEGLAVVEGLKPGTEYSYLIYQHASSFAGVHEYKVNGRTRGETTSGTTDEATGNGLAVADTDGKVTFAFQRESSKSGGDHVALTGLALAEAEPCYELSTFEENNFGDKGDTTLSRHSTNTFTLSCGYVAKLSGWTHSRNYH